MHNLAFLHSPFFLPIVAFLLSGLAILWIRKNAYRYGWTSKVSADRWAKRPVALHGGWGVFIGFLVSLIAVISYLPHEYFGLVAGLILMFITGWIDDIKNLSPRSKLPLQIFAAILFLAFYHHYLLKADTWLIYALYIVWIVGITNALNLLDNMDGIAGIVSLIIITIYILLFSYLNHSGFAAILTLGTSLGAAILAFLLFNASPASIYLGDSGALMIGYFIACLGIIFTSNTGNFADSMSHHRVFAYFITILICFIPILDTSFVTVTRKLKGHRVMLGGKDHIAHRLVKRGLTEKVVLVVLSGASLAAGLIVLPLVIGKGAVDMIKFIVIFYLALMAVLLLKRAARRKEEAVSPTPTQLQQVEMNE